MLVHHSASKSFGFVGRARLLPSRKRILRSEFHQAHGPASLAPHELTTQSVVPLFFKATS